MSSIKVERECRVVFLGESGVGKTSIISRYCTTNYKIEQKKTIAVNLDKKAISIKDKSIDFKIWDTPVPQDRTVLDAIYKEANIIFLVYTRDSSTFIEVRDFWYKRVAEKARNKPVIFLVKSKCDKDTKNVLTNDEMEFLASSGIQFQLVSAKDNLKIDDLFRTAGREFLKKK